MLDSSSCRTMSYGRGASPTDCCSIFSRRLTRLRPIWRNGTARRWSGSHRKRDCVKVTAGRLSLEVWVLRLEWAALGLSAEALVEVDGAANQRNVCRRQAPRVLIDDYRLAVRCHRHLHGLEGLALVFSAQIECVIADHGPSQSAR